MGGGYWWGVPFRNEARYPQSAAGGLVSWGASPLPVWRKMRFLKQSTIVIQKQSQPWLSRFPMTSHLDRPSLLSRLLSLYICLENSSFHSAFRMEPRWPLAMASRRFLATSLMVGFDQA